MGPYNRNVDINRMRPQVSMPPPQQPQVMRQDDQRARLAQTMAPGGGLQQGLQGPSNMMMQQMMKQAQAKKAAQQAGYQQAVNAGPQMPPQGIDAARARLASMGII